MIGPVRAWRRWRLHRQLLVEVPLPYRALFEGGHYPPAPPTPATLRDAAKVLEQDATLVDAGTWFNNHTSVSDWLRALADLLPEPYAYREYFAPTVIPETAGLRLTLADIQYHHQVSGLCTATSPRLWPCGMPYVCTLDADHGGGVHIAEGPDGEVYDTWPT